MFIRTKQKQTMRIEVRLTVWTTGRGSALRGGGGAGTGAGAGAGLVPSARKYSEGLIRECSSPSALLGNLGGMNGKTICLLTRLGPCGCGSDTGALSAPAARK